MKIKPEILVYCTNSQFSYRQMKETDILNISGMILAYSCSAIKIALVFRTLETYLSTFVKIKSYYE